MMENKNEKDEAYELISDGMMKIGVTNDSDEATEEEYLETSSISSSEESEVATCPVDNDEMEEVLEDEMQYEVSEFEEGDEFDIFGGEEEDRINIKEEKRKVLEKVVNEEFKAYVGQLLQFFDICESEGYESWVDVVTSAAWKAASFVRPDALQDKARNLNHCVKIICVASGSPTQSEVVKGLVFKKHAAHKHMPTEVNNPKLLLARGWLGTWPSASSSGLMSFATIQQTRKNDELMRLGQCLEAWGANVILVEKGVSRDVVDYVLDHGLHITIVPNMQLHRLERVARCTGSSIVAVDVDAVSEPLCLTHCNRVVFRKILEEHAHAHTHTRDDGGPIRRPCRTFMFIQPCPTRLGCTILLKGSHNGQLGKIKRVARAAVFRAYHLIREISFRMELNAMFSAALLTDNTLESVYCSSGTDTTTTAAASALDGIHVVSMTILNFSRGIVCDHGRCSNTNFTLAKYIQDNLLNQNRRCKTCGEEGEAHIYYYAHKQQQVAVRVQQVGSGSGGGGELQQRLWFWSRCGKCQVIENEEVKAPAKRVLISHHALGLPFGRFLELHFSKPSPFDFQPICAHSPHNHFLLFIGSGSMVAVFKYSPMAMLSEEMWEGNGSSSSNAVNNNNNNNKVLPLLNMRMSCCHPKGSSPS